MAVTEADISFLLAARELGADYERTLTIGRQWLFATPAQIVSAHADAGQSLDVLTAERLVQEGGRFAAPIFHHLGAHRLDSLDASTYEGSSLIHDLNDPLPDELHDVFTVVFDGGSLEHVFNFPQALKNCMQSVAPGGHLITITPTNSFLGHGFYQFSPELFYRALSPANGFTVVALLTRSTHRWAGWRAVTDPASAGARVTMSGPWPAFIYVLARRTAQVEPFADWPQQSDYVSAWEGGETAAPSRLRSRVVRRLPPSARQVTEAVRAATAVLGRSSGPGHFRRVRMVDVARAGPPADPTSRER